MEWDSADDVHPALSSQEAASPPPSKRELGEDDGKDRAGKEKEKDLLNLSMKSRLISEWPKH